MRFTQASVQTLVVFLLAKDVAAGVHGRHADYHLKRRDMVTVTDDVWVTVTEDILQTITDTCYVTVEWPGTAAQPVVTTDVVSVLPVEATPTPTPSTQDAEFLENHPSTTPKPVAMAPTTAKPAEEPATTPVPVVVPATTPKPAEVPATTPKPAEVPATTPAPAPVVVPTTMATVVKPSTTPAPAPVTPIVAQPAPAPATGGKRGIAYNDPALTNPFGSGKVTWAYNWDSVPSGNLRAGLEFVPLLWGMGAEHTTNWAKNAAAAIASGSTHLSGFNEPDLGSQSNLDVGTAVAGWKQYMEPFAGKATLISPAVTNGGAPMGIGWLTSFLQQCTGCHIGCVAIHWYAGADSIQYFKDHVTEAHTATGKCVWVTEFQPISGTPAEISTFLTAAMAWMDGQDFVERYAYFMATNGNLINGNGLSALGNVYNS